MELSRPWFDARRAGALLTLLGFALLWGGEPWQAALGLELFATAFWVWARESDNPGMQVARWAWCAGRPARCGSRPQCTQRCPRSFTRRTPRRRPRRRDAPARSLAVVWAGLELLAALPIERPYADIPGPLLAMREWLPVVLPAAGFAVLWRYAPHWMTVAPAREAAIVLLLVTSVLGSIRAFGRRQWTSGLRWLLVSDAALAGVLVALDAVPSLVSFMLWGAACGGRAYLLAGELRGAAPRRGQVLSQLWRAAMTVASASLAWPVLMTLGVAPGRARPIYFLAALVPVVLGTAITMRRHVEAPERRLIMRPRPLLSLGHIVALATLGLGPLALALAWWRGFETSLPALLVGVLPLLLGAAVAMPGRDLVLRTRARRAARGLFRFVVERERWLVVAIARIARGLSAPLRDLHTGDAQEYLLFVIGVAVLALLIPLLQ
jgi:hypothetical protein